MLDKQEIIRRVQKNLPKYYYKHKIMLYHYIDKEDPKSPWRKVGKYEQPNVAQAVEFILRMLEEDDETGVQL